MNKLNKGCRTVEVHRNQSGVVSTAPDQVAVEVPVALVYNGISHVVMMATPENLDDFVVGFSFTEGIIESPGELYDMEVNKTERGIELQMTISERQFQKFKKWRRNMMGRTGCGLCGAESLEQVLRLPPSMVRGDTVATEAIRRAMQALPNQQLLNGQTGAVHAAAWADLNGAIVELREDVGRHNALDKLIGALLHTERSDGFLVVTSRASYEMVQKAGWANMGVLAAVSAPTSLAIELAERLNMTLLGFVRDKNFVCYANKYGVLNFG